MEQEADALSCGFPPGYFLIRSIGANRFLDVSANSIADGTEVILWPETEGSIVEDLRNPNSDNQVFFVDDTGSLCSKASGHAIDVQDRKLVLRHRRPKTDPYPNAHSHPLPKFLYSSISGHISVSFSYDPSFPTSSNQASSSETYQGHILTSVPMRKPRTMGDDVVDLFSKVVSNPFSFFSGQTTTSVSETDEGNYDIREEELLEEDRIEEEGDDSSLEPLRKVRVLNLAGTGDTNLYRKALERLKWDVIPLRKSRAGWPR